MRKQKINNQWYFKKQGEQEATCISLPHDAMLYEGRDAKNKSGSAGAFFCGGVYVYTKYFTLSNEHKNKEISFAFEGVYKDALVKINGVEVCKQENGYNPFMIEATKYVTYDEENVLEVHVHNEDQPNSRWYTGSGIYRDVWMYTKNKDHIKHEGLKITTLSSSPARIQVETLHTGEDVVISIFDGVKHIETKNGTVVTFEVEDAKLWSAEHPYLYQVHAKVLRNGIVKDEVIENFGIRKLEWSTNGLFVNGEEVLLKGGCIHHDHGVIGAANYKEAEFRRVSIMKEAGYNALRISHNPASKGMLEACDTVGMYVIDETWDMWFSKKSENDYAKHFMKNFKEDLEVLVRRDYNHPSVIMYSIGNEVSEPVKEHGMEVMKEMIELVHSLDSTRIVTCGVNLWLLYEASKGQGHYEEKNKKEETSEAPKKMEMNSTLFNMIAASMGTKINNGAATPEADEVVSPCLDLLDVAGYNYSSGRYPLDGVLHPNRIIMGSETYPQDIYKNWMMVKELPYLIGDFVWTSWDYLGEVGLGAWAYSDDAACFEKPYPWLLADTGTISILGDIGAQADYAATIWENRSKPSIHVRPVKYAGQEPIKMVWRGSDAMPSWAWSNCEGKMATVEVYTTAYEVALYSNDEHIETKLVSECKCMFEVPYQAGCLKAIAYDEQKQELASSELHAASGTTRIRVCKEESRLENPEIIYVNIDLVGENGVIECNKDQALKITVEGGILVGYGSANPRTVDDFTSGKYTTYYGRSQAIIKLVNNEKVKVKVVSENVGTCIETL